MTNSSNENLSDCFKTLNDWALSAGRSLQSKQTGYLHYYYGEDSQQSHTIPLVENCLFILALFRSRLVEQVQEAKGLLKGLLQFQNLHENDSYGNFPLYLHQYPICYDYTLGLQLLAPFYWIIKLFGHILGTDLKSQIEKAAKLILQFSLRIHGLKPFSYSNAVRLAAAQYAFGSLWKDDLLLEQGELELNQLSQNQLLSWESTKHLSEILIGLQMVYPSLQKNSPWKSLWQYMEMTWHQQTGCYIGPCSKELHEQEEPQSTLYDLFNGCFARQFSKRATLSRPYHLYGALIQPSTDKFEPHSPTHLIKGHHGLQIWRTLSTPVYAYTFLESKEMASIHSLWTPFRLIWGDSSFVHSFVCQGISAEDIEIMQEESTIKVYFKLSENPQSDSFPLREIQFFANFSPDHVFTLDGLSTNTFKLGQTLQCKMNQQQVSLKFDLIDGDGTFLGHIMRGNRPSQVNRKGDKRFQAYDWMFFLRTLRRQKLCKIQCTITLG